MVPSRLAKALVPEAWKVRIKDHLDVPSVGRSLRLLRANGFDARIAIDAGAYQGEWTQMIRRIWPGCASLMIEANPERALRLQEYARQEKGLSAKQALLGAQGGGDVPFYEQDSASSVLPESAKKNQDSRLLQMSTLDDVTAGTEFRNAQLIKLDVQGYELEILKGGRETLRNVEVVIMEVNLIGIYRGAPLFGEAVEFLGDCGFQVYDVATLYRRPLDGALWQVDLVFLRQDSKLLSSLRFE